MNKPAQTSIFVIPATDAPIAAILRRSPSKHVLLLKWNLETDQIEAGQWFKGRIYERRCDLSPNGKHLLYAAANNRPPMYSWTAISQPPYLTAIELWPNGGHWGGGLFPENNAVELNIWPESCANRGRLKVPPSKLPRGKNADLYVQHELLLKHNWQHISDGECIGPFWCNEVVYRYTKPMVYRKTSAAKHVLEMQLKGIGQKNKANYWVDYQICDSEGNLLFTLERADWADWHNSDLLFAKDGKIYRLPKAHVNAEFTLDSTNLKLIADLTPLKFECKTTPKGATTW